MHGRRIASPRTPPSCNGLAVRNHKSWELCRSGVGGGGVVMGWCLCVGTVECRVFVYFGCIVVVTGWYFGGGVVGG